MSPPVLIQIALLLPLLAAVASGLLGRWPNLRETATLVCGGLLFVVMLLLAGPVFAGGRPQASWIEVLPGLSLAFRIEPLGMLFALVASGLWVVTTCYSIGYMRSHHEQHQSRFFGCFAIAIFAAVGAAFSANMFALFVFYEVLTVSTYPLVTHHGNEPARRGGRTYIGVLFFTSITFLLLAVVWTWTLAGTLDFRPGGILAGKASPGMVCALLLLYGFGTGKAALMPFHRWLPAAMVAPTPVSALLHAVAVVKVGVFTILKVVIYIFGLELLDGSWARLPLMTAAGVTVVLASLIALTRDNLKARLAYSTVSQLSYIVLGAALANSWSVVGGGMHIVMHAVSKITLFFCAGAYYVTAHKTEISDMAGIGRAMPITTFAFLLGSLSIIGLPPFGGAWSKWYLALGAADAEQLIFLAVLMISSLLNIAYLMPIVVRGYFFSPPTGVSGELKEAPLFCLIPLSLTALGMVALFFFADQIYEILLPVTLPGG